MIELQQNFDNNIPIYLQVIDLIKTDIIIGKILPGDKLLSVRDYAIKLKVNPNTMQKALVELENMGLIYTERTNGKFVTNNPKLINKIRDDEANKICQTYIDSMELIGINKDEAIKFLKGKE